MVAVTGFYGHIKKNHSRSIIMFIGFALAMQLAFAALLAVPLTLKGDMRVVFVDPAGYFKFYGPVVFTGSLLLFMISYVFHTGMTKLATGFEYVQEFENRRLQSITANLAHTAGIPVPKLGIIHTPALNSFACGLSAKSATIVVTEGLLAELNDDELQAVIAHEIVHILNGDIEMMAVANASQSIISLVNFINPFQMRSGKAAGCLIFFLPLVILLGMIGFVIKASTTITSVTRYFITSSREFIADAEAVRLTHNPAALISALSKIEGRSLIPHLDKVTDSMMIDGPVDGQFASHPPIFDRIAALRQYAGSMVHGASYSKDTRGFGRRRAPVFAEPLGAKAAYRARANRNIINRVNEDSDRNIFGIPKSAGLTILLGTALVVGWQSYAMKKSQKAWASDPNYLGPDAMVVYPEIKLSPVFAVIDIEGNGLFTKSLSQTKAYYDVHSKGQKTKTGWLGSEAGFLFHDRNGNKRPDGIGEMVTTSLEQSKTGRNINVLRQFDANRDNVVDKRDAKFGQLYVWKDYGSDGVFEKNEGFSLGDLGITGLNIAGDRFDNPEGVVTVASGAQLIRKGTFARDPQKAPVYHRNPAKGAIFLTAFKTDIARYKADDGEIKIASHAKPQKVVAKRGELRPMFKSVSSELERPPKRK